jgi:hypothetical protein
MAGIIRTLYVSEGLRRCHQESLTLISAEQVQIALLRQAGMAGRVEFAAELTSFAIGAAYTALRRRYPTASALELKLLFVEQQYGLPLAIRLRAALMPQAGERDSS